MLQDPAHHRAGARPDPGLAAPRADRRPRHQRRRGRHLHGLGPRRPAPRGERQPEAATDACGHRQRRAAVRMPSDDHRRLTRRLRLLPAASGGPAWRPFCSERCKLQDLARWADGAYRVTPATSRESIRTTRATDVRLDTDATSMADTLTITDNRTGKKYELPDQGRHHPAMDLRQIKAGAGRLRADDLRPGVHEHRVLPERITYIDGDKGILRYRGYPDRAAGRAQQLPRDGLPDPVRRAADRGAAAGVDARRSRMHTMLHENIKKFMEGFRYDAHPMGDLPQHRRRALDVLPRRASSIFDAESRQLQIHRLIAKVPTHRRLRLPPQHRPAVHLPGQRPQLHRQLPEHAVQDDRAEVPAEPGARRARSTCCSSCTPTTSRTAAPARCAPSAARTSIRTRRWPARRRRSTARCTAAPTKRCCACSTRSARSSNVPEFIKKVKAGEGAA